MGGRGNAVHIIQPNDVSPTTHNEECARRQRALQRATSPKPVAVGKSRHCRCVVVTQHGRCFVVSAHWDLRGQE